MAVLVIGGAGYIGSHMVRHLGKNNIEAIVFDNFEKGHREAVGSAPVFEGDLRNKADVSRVFETQDISAVMHFSAYSLVGESMQHPGMYYENNIGGTLNVLEAMKRAGVRHFIFSSTAAVYGEPVTIPIDEGHPAAPTNVYGETKLAVEKMLGWFDHVHGIKSVCLRYFNAAGADPSGEIGELHDPESHLIPLVLAAAGGQRDAISIFGDDYDTRDGTCVRDYIHVNDLADAHLRAIAFLSESGRSEVFNLGNGSGYTVKEIIDVAQKVTGCRVPVKKAPRRAGDPAVLIASSDKARRVLGWEPRLYDIETIVKTAWKWHSGKAREWENA